MKQSTQIGASIKEAISLALQKLGKTPEQVDVEVLQEGKKGFFGFGARPAEVRVTVKEKKTEQVKKKKNESTCRCDLCEKPIRKEIYQKIEDWARGEGNWDYEPSFIGYKKVLCLDCQIEQDIFKKKLFASKK